MNALNWIGAAGVLMLGSGLVMVARDGKQPDSGAGTFVGGLFAICGCGTIAFYALVAVVKAASL